jgi:putative two-component system response regulator
MRELPTGLEDVRLSGRRAFHRLALVVERRSGDAGSHSRRTSDLVDAVARRLSVPDEKRALLTEASVFHDIGKVAIPDRILCRTGPLDAGERVVVETHTEIGYWLMAGRSCPLLDLAAEIALLHHENLDGSGYPYGIAGDDIPLEARIVSVCDVFDALTSDRTYRPAFTVAESLQMIVDDVLRKFDPPIVEALRAEVEEWGELAASDDRPAIAEIALGEA